MKEVISLTLIFTFLIWGSYRDLGIKDYDLRQHSADTIVYNTTQIIAKKGILHGSTYDDMKLKLEVSGDYDILLLAERFESDGSSTTLENNSVVGFNLREHEFDLITIYVVNKKDLLVNKVYKSYPLNIDTNYNVIAQSCSYIE